MTTRDGGRGEGAIPRAHLPRAQPLRLPFQGASETIHGPGLDRPVQEFLPHCQREAGTHQLVQEIFQRE